MDPLTPFQQQALSLLEDIPEAHQPRALALLRTLAWFTKETRCQGMLAEGFPCGDPAMACDECQQVWDLLQRLERRA